MHIHHHRKELLGTSGCQEIVQGLLILWANKRFQIGAEKGNFKANNRNIQHIV